MDAASTGLVADRPSLNSFNFTQNTATSVATQPNGTIGAWQDLSGNNRHLGAYDGPKLKAGAINGHPAIDLDASGARLIGYKTPLSAEMTVFILLDRRSPQAGFVTQILSHGDPSADWSMVNLGDVKNSMQLRANKDVVGAQLIASNNQQYILVGTLGKDKRTFTASYGTVQQAYGSGVAISADKIGGEYPFAVGGNTGVAANPYVGEIAYYNRVLTPAERAQVLGKMAQNWDFPGCNNDNDCNPFNPCLTGKCNGKAGCEQIAVVGLCDVDNDACTNDECSNGSCVLKGKVKCDDNNVCTDDFCELGGCKAKENVLPCDDGDVCTVSDTCFQKVCKGQVNSCDDKNPCTDDACVKGVGCQSVANQAACDDGNVCTDNDKCANSVCKPGAANNLVCDDGDPCSVNDACAGGKCTGGGAKACPDDGNKCTNEFCANKACTSQVVYCNDANLCTDDYCDKDLGCLTKGNSAPNWSDGDLCTVFDYCFNKKCISGPKADCEDGDPCTSDPCNPLKGCGEHIAQVKCEDGDDCTVNDTCKNGACVPGTAADCDDGNSCTTDYCLSLGGCAHDGLATGTACSDGDPCTAPDSCVPFGPIATCKAGVKNCDWAVNTLADLDAYESILGKPLSLRMAMTIANSKGNAGIIHFFLSGTVKLNSALPTVTTNMTIDGNGNTVLIDGLSKSQIIETKANLSLKNLILQNGYAGLAPGVDGVGNFGGGLRALGAGANSKVVVNIDSCTLQSSQSVYGGAAIYGEFADIALVKSSISKNTQLKSQASDAANAKQYSIFGGGGGIRVKDASLVVEHSKLDYNLSAGAGGALFCGSGSTCKISGSSMRFNSAAYGGAVANAGESLMLVNSTFAQNTAMLTGGAILTSNGGVPGKGGTFVINCTIAANFSNGPNGIAAYFDAPTSAENSIFAQNGLSGVAPDCAVGPSGALAQNRSIVTWTADASVCADCNPCVAWSSVSPNLGGAKTMGIYNTAVLVPKAGSKAINNGALNVCLDPSVGGVDQVDTLRPKGNGCDIGAFEQ